MTAKVSVSHIDGVALVTIDNPPVNALGAEVRAGLAEAMAALEQDGDTIAVVLNGTGRTFSAGADITEFGKTPKQPILPQVIRTIEDMTKPVVAAIHGTAFGGALELTLGCHARVAAPGTKLGLPEVKLGLLPGAGGTQRLPRIIGPVPALRLIVTGEPLTAEQALEAGLINALAADPVAEAVALARRLATEDEPLMRVRDRDDLLAPVRADRTEFENAAQSLLKSAKGLRAPSACVEAVRWSLDLPIDEALTRERETFMTLVHDDQSRAQRHVFFAEREAAKVADLPKGARPRDVRRVAVIGAGTMGGGIAMAFANAGLPVTLVETGDDALNRGLGTIERNYRASVSRGRIGESEMSARLDRIDGTTDLSAVADADLVIEAVFEEMEIKKNLFRELDRLAQPSAILATNTSYLDVDEIAASTSRPSSVLGMHFFSPANVMRLLEVVRAKETAPDVLATAISLARAIGKVPAVVGVCHGFVGNRMLRARSLETEQLLLEGARPQDVDGALKDFGFPMGPFAMADLAGLDVGWRMRKAQGLTAPIADRLCEAGRFGQKTGKGFYLYEEGKRKPLPDPEVERLIEETARAQGVERRRIASEEIVERLIYPMISEGARILEEGIAQRPGDIDVIWIYGYGFPLWRGGPMYHADQVGLAHIRDRLNAYAERSGRDVLRPAPLLDRLADEGGTFASFAAGETKAA